MSNNAYTAFAKSLVYPGILPLTVTIKRYERRQNLAGLLSHLLAIHISETC